MGNSKSLKVFFLWIHNSHKPHECVTQALSVQADHHKKIFFFASYLWFIPSSNLVLIFVSSTQLYISVALMALCAVWMWVLMGNCGLKCKRAIKKQVKTLWGTLLLLAKREILAIISLTWWSVVTVCNKFQCDVLKSMSINHSICCSDIWVTFCTVYLIKVLHCFSFIFLYIIINPLVLKIPEYNIGNGWFWPFNTPNYIFLKTQSLSI